jgi:hypothetical protein
VGGNVDRNPVTQINCSLESLRPCINSPFCTRSTATLLQLHEKREKGMQLVIALCDLAKGLLAEEELLRRKEEQLQREKNFLSKENDKDRNFTITLVTVTMEQGI